MVNFFGSCVFDDLSGVYTHLFFLPLLEDLERAGDYAWGPALSWIYRELGRSAFRIGATPLTITLVTLEARWQWSRCGHWRDYLLQLDEFTRSGHGHRRGGLFLTC
ncbi:hypothetical protein LINPERPRIM_LOCUS33021 [Linum perenne]